MTSDEPFGRQPLPVKITMDGETIDIDYWFNEMKRMIESRGYNTVQRHRNIFTIYPGAVND